MERAPGVTDGGNDNLPEGPDFIIIARESLGEINHKIGHFFRRCHTFETRFGLELANGTNCASQDDLVFNTPAFPGLGNTPAPDCNLSPYIKDPNNEWYVPMIGNTMSYYSDDCSCGFTTGQYDRMANKYLNDRFYLW